MRTHPFHSSSHFLLKGMFILSATISLANATQPDPAWWGQRPSGGDPVVIAGAEDHHAPATIGQAKWMVKRALDQISKFNPPLADAIRGRLAASPAVVDFSVPATPDPAWHAGQHSPLLIGQLKALAAPFYEEINATSGTVLASEMTLYGTRDPSDPDNIFPWSGGTSEGNHAPTNIGQLKACFALRLDDKMALTFSDTDRDGMQDGWEIIHGLNPSSHLDKDADPDGDAISNQIEYFLGFDPNNSTSNGTDPDNARDRDGDGMPDIHEARMGGVSAYTKPGTLFFWYYMKAPLDWELADNDGDPDGDGLSNYQEYLHGTRFDLADTDGDEISDATEITNGTNPLVMTLPAQLQALVDDLESIDSRLVGKDPATSMNLYSNTTALWSSDVFVWNGDNWLNDYRDQLDGFHMYAGTQMQRYGLMPVTPRHLLSCGHDGPNIQNPPHTIRYVNPETNEVFETTLKAWINDYHTPNRTADLSVYITADELPSWVNIAPIFPALGAYEKRILERRDVPSILVSQGNRLPTDPEVASIPKAQTPKNRKAHIRGLFSNREPSPLRASFSHDLTSGDSGTPRYVLAKGTLYLYGVTRTGDGVGPVVADSIPYINSLITRANAAAIFTPPTPLPGQDDPYVVKAAPMPTY